MGGQSVVLRAAEPTVDEGLVFGRYLDEAAEGFMRFMLGRHAPQVIAEAYTQPDNDYSFQNVVFAEYEGSIVGMAAGFTAKDHRRFSDRPLKQAAEFPALRMRAVSILCAPLLRILESIPDGSFYLLAMAVEENIRGRGVGSSLFDSVELRARQSGSSRLSLDVSVKNEGARQLYERRGLSVTARWPTLRILPPLFVRMTKAL